MLNISKLISEYGRGELLDKSGNNDLHEAKLLTLNINKAKSRLDWHPRLNINQCISLVVDWYKRYKSENVYELCIEEINQFLKS